MTIFCTHYDRYHYFLILQAISRMFWDTECPILLLVLFVRNCTRYVHTIKERKVYMSILSSAYEIGITYKDNIIDSF